MASASLLRVWTVEDGSTLCDWQLVSEDWASSRAQGASPSTGFACTDYDGNVCDFAFDVVLSDATATGPECDAFTLPDEGLVGLGYHADYQAAGVSYGPALMYFLDYANIDPSLPAGIYAYWLGLAVPVTFDGTTLTYELDYGATSYTP